MFLIKDIIGSLFNRTVFSKDVNKPPPIGTKWHLFTPFLPSHSDEKCPYRFSNDPR